MKSTHFAMTFTVDKSPVADEWSERALGGPP